MVCYHAAPKLVTGGFIGVDIFFVISGYLITGIIVSGMESGQFSLKDFYIRRCRRILPALFTMLVAIWALGWAVLLPAEFEDLGKEMLAGVTFSENFLLLNEVGYFDIEAGRKPLLHLWSLAIEEQFYLFWPLIVLLAMRLRIRLTAVSFFLMLASFAFGTYYFNVNPSGAFYLLPSRFWEILGGACVFHWQCRPHTGRWISANGKALAAGAILFIFAFWFYAFLSFEEDVFYPQWAAFPCLAAMLLISAGQDAWFNCRIMSSPPLVAIGRISYPLYLWHWPLLALARIVEDEQPIPVIRGGAVALAFLLAWLTFRWMETPVRRTSSAFSRPRFAAFSALAAACVVSILGSHAGFWGTPWGTNTLQFNSMDSASVQNVLNRTWEKRERVDAACTASSWNPSHLPINYCRLTGDAPRVAVFGDSHANHLVAGLAAANHPDFSPVVEVNFGCNALEQGDGTRAQPVAGKVNDCSVYRQYFFNKVSHDPTIHNVILSRFWYGGDAIDRLESLTGTEDDATLNPTERVYKNLLHTVDVLEQSGKQVFYVMDVPNLGFSPLRCLNVRWFSMTSRNRVLCARPRAEVMGEQDTMRRMLAILAKRHPKMKVFDPIPALCDAEYCYAIRDGKLLYRDGDHLSLDGSNLVAGAFLERMAKPE